MNVLTIIVKHLPGEAIATDSGNCNCNSGRDFVNIEAMVWCFLVESKNRVDQKSKQ